MLIETIVNALPALLPALIGGIVALIVGIANALPTIIVAIVDALPTVIQSICTALIENIPILIQGAIPVSYTHLPLRYPRKRGRDEPVLCPC